MPDSPEYDLRPTPASDPWVLLVHVASGQVVCRIDKRELAIALAPAPVIVLAR